MGGAATLHAAKYMSSEVKKDLENLGFLIAADKSHWEPVQELVWLAVSYTHLTLPTICSV